MISLFAINHSSLVVLKTLAFAESKELLIAADIDIETARERSKERPIGLRPGAHTGLGLVE